MRIMPVKGSDKRSRSFAPANVKPKTPGDMKMAAQAKPRASGNPEPMRGASKSAGIKPGRERIFMIGGREYTPRRVPQGLDRYQAGRLEFHREAYSNLGGTFSNFIRAASRQQLKKAA